MIDVGCTEHYYTIRTNSTTTHNVILRHNGPEDTSAVDALHNISRLCYGLRCVLVHGIAEKTLNDGALKDFPDNIDEFLLPNENDEAIKEYYVGLYIRIKEYKRNVDLSYLTLLNVICFLRYAACSLMRAVAKWFYDIQQGEDKQCIWKYPPQNAENKYLHLHVCL